jgi:lipoate-protein ligase A
LDRRNRQVAAHFAIQIQAGRDARHHVKAINLKPLRIKAGAHQPRPNAANCRVDLVRGASEIVHLMHLAILPTRTARAAENMASDFLLLQRYPEPSIPRFRHYEWFAPACTFGFSQKIATVRPQLPDEPIDLCRRPTGGGIVDHRDDWTYALVIPRGHALEEQRATQSYRVIHEAVAHALRSQGIPASLKLATDEPEESAGVCFQRAELFDVIHQASGAKIAGAAQKRNKHGLLFQGSIARVSISSTTFAWEQFEDEFPAQLAIALGTEAQTVPWPEINEEELSGLIDQYSSSEWIEYR